MSPSPATMLAIRQMRLEDLEQVMEIEERVFPTPWSMNSYRFELTENQASRLWVCQASTTQQENLIAGMIVVWLLVDEAHIGTIAVDLPFRRQGIACRLLHTALQACVGEGAISASLEVRQHNSAAQGLYHRFGFRPVGRRQHYYHDNGEDAILMNLDHLSAARLEKVVCA
ncbi:MAG: ribosomal protein S18-alanine N-acetyltransferase [Anaerolineae bacterium]|nr:ribosomal protein S18-alanine N-acetyltransferase [Anaerolineae bacterium]